MKRPKTIVELFQNHPERWLQRCNSRNRFGERVRPSDPSARCWCLFGAACYIYPLGASEIIRKLERVLGLYYGKEFSSTVEYNDRPECTVNDIIAVAREAGV